MHGCVKNIDVKVPALAKCCVVEFTEIYYSQNLSFWEGKSLYFDENLNATWEGAVEYILGSVCAKKQIIPSYVSSKFDLL